MDRLLKNVDTWFHAPFETVERQYGGDENSGRASLSWHLTSKEEQTIRMAIDKASNQQQLKKLHALFEAQ